MNFLGRVLAALWTGVLLAAVVRAESVSVAEAHLSEGGSSYFEPFFHSFGDEVNSSPLDAMAKVTVEQFSKPFHAFSRVTLDSAKHQFQLGASVAVFDLNRVRIPEATYTRGGKARAFHEEKLHFSSVMRHRNATVHLRFKVIGSLLDETNHESGTYAMVALRKNGEMTFPRRVSGKLQDSYDLAIPITELNRYGVDVVYSAELIVVGYLGFGGFVNAEFGGDDPAKGGLFLRRIDLTDADGNSLDDLKITSESGFDYNAFFQRVHGRFLDFSGEYRGVLRRVVDDEVSPLADGVIESRITGSSISFAIMLEGKRYAGVGKVRGLGPVTFGLYGQTVTELHDAVPGIVVSLSLAQNGDAYSLIGTAREIPSSTSNDTPTWRIEAGHANYTDGFDRWGTDRRVPAPLVGGYTALLDPPANQPGMVVPLGAGWAMLRVRTNGMVTLVGRLADGAAISAAGALTEGARWPFAASPYGRRGSLIGVADFREDAALSNVEAVGVRWVRPAKPGSRYAEGWPDGVAVDLRGVRSE